MRAEPLRELAAATAVTGPSPCEQSAAPATPAAPAAPAPLPPLPPLQVQPARFIEGRTSPTIWVLLYTRF